VATNERHMPVAPELVWAALEDPAGYADWVVGSKAVRGADAGFPAPGTRLHHTVGIGPLALRDHTEVVEAERPRFLCLRAKGRPLGIAVVILELVPADGGTTVRMSEWPDGPLAIVALNPVVDVLTRVRNAESLKRLERLVMRRTV